MYFYKSENVAVKLYIIFLIIKIQKFTLLRDYFYRVDLFARVHSYLNELPHLPTNRHKKSDFELTLKTV